MLVLLDHGLYKQLPTDFRLDYWWVVLACFGVERMHAPCNINTHTMCEYNPAHSPYRVYRTRTHSRLWKALVLKDLEGVKHYCQKLNAGEMYSLLAAVLTSRSWDDITRSVSLGRWIDRPTTPV